MESVFSEKTVIATKKGELKPSIRRSLLAACFVVICSALATLGCYNTPIATSELAQGPAPLHNPSPAREATECDSYEDSLTGGQVFTMYCSYCHNAPSLGERPYAQFRNISAHMRIRANLTGKEYAKLSEFLRRWNDVPPPSPPVEPSPKRFYFSQPLNELQPQKSPSPTDTKPPVLPDSPKKEE